jgi:flagellar biosynthetic protein FlhB
VVGNLAQVGFVASLHGIKPKVERINPFKGIKRLFSPQSAWEAGKVLIKTSVLAFVAWGPLSEITATLVGAGRLPFAETVAVVAVTGLDLVRNTALAGLVLAAVDYGLQRRRVTKQLKMTKQEVKDEHRQSEGDPSLKGQIRQRQLEMSRNRMMAEVATASAVVVNPTHVAVAIRYDPTTGAPRVVAKGKGLVAARIRAEAERHGVPLVRDVALARTLVKVCDLGAEIPVELYEAVARILAFVFALKRKGGMTGGVLPAPPAPARI